MEGCHSASRCPSTSIATARDTPFESEWLPRHSDAASTTHWAGACPGHKPSQRGAGATCAVEPAVGDIQSNPGTPCSPTRRGNRRLKFKRRRRSSTSPASIELLCRYQSTRRKAKKTGHLGALHVGHSRKKTSSSGNGPSRHGVSLQKIRLGTRCRKILGRRRMGVSGPKAEMMPLQDHRGNNGCAPKKGRSGSTVRQCQWRSKTSATSGACASLSSNTYRLYLLCWSPPWPAVGDRNEQRSLEWPAVGDRNEQRRLEGNAEPQRSVFASSSGQVSACLAPFDSVLYYKNKKLLRSSCFCPSAQSRSHPGSIPSSSVFRKMPIRRKAIRRKRIREAIRRKRIQRADVRRFAERESVVTEREDRDKWEWGSRVVWWESDDTWSKPEPACGSSEWVRWESDDTWSKSEPACGSSEWVWGESDDTWSNSEPAFGSGVPTKTPVL